MGGMFIEKIKIPIVPDIMRIDTWTQSIDIQQIDNRRFMYNPDTRLLVLGRQYEAVSLTDSSHAGELVAAGIIKDYDAFVRGWVGTGGNYPVGVVHFAPSVDARNIELFDRAFDTLKMFANNGLMYGTVIRGFGKEWERPASAILTDIWQPAAKLSVRKRLKKHPEAKATRQKTNHQQER